jgi:hypothetical protein
VRILLLSFAHLGAGCAEDPPRVEVCTNLEDDDGDALADCADPECAGPRCPESCLDGWDNDGDRMIDCDDPHCDGSCLESCHDGRDNDGDALADCADDECVGASVETCADFVDDDCDGRVDCLDPDCDGACPESCTDGRDNDGDGSVDCADPDCDGDAECPEDCVDGRDNDLDGATDCADFECEEDCDQDEDGFATIAGGGDDCDDADAQIHPDADEICNDGIDDDCNGFADDDDPELDTDTTVAWFLDADEDGYGALFVDKACAAIAGTSAAGGDCDDFDADRHPDANEICETPDDDCDGLVDDEDPSLDLTSALPFYEDVDGDGHGDAGTVQLACTAPPGFATASDDCHLFDAEIWQETEWWLDADGDGWGAGSAVWSCARPVDHAPVDGDCDDADPDLHPGVIGTWPSLIGAWQGDGDAADGSGPAAGGVLVDGAGFTTGIYEEAFSFDGAGDRMEIAFTRGGPFTLSLWVEAAVLPQPFAGVLSTSDTASPDSFELRLLDPDLLEFHNNLTDADLGVVALGWTQVAVAYDGISIRTWADGVPLDTETWSPDSPPTFDLLRLGSDRTGTVDFSGSIDDVLVFDRALSDAEVAAIADASASCLEL